MYKARREEERRVRRELYKQAWAAYRQAHIVHLGRGVFWHDTADVDRFDATAIADTVRSALDDDALAGVVARLDPALFDGESLRAKEAKIRAGQTKGTG